MSKTIDFSEVFLNCSSSSDAFQCCTHLKNVDILAMFKNTAFKKESKKENSVDDYYCNFYDMYSKLTLNYK